MYCEKDANKQKIGLGWPIFYTNPTYLSTFSIFHIYNLNTNAHSPVASNSFSIRCKSFSVPIYLPTYRATIIGTTIVFLSFLDVFCLHILPFSWTLHSLFPLPTYAQTSCTFSHFLTLYLSSSNAKTQTSPSHSLIRKISLSLTISLHISVNSTFPLYIWLSLSLFISFSLSLSLSLSLSK